MVILDQTWSLYDFDKLQGEKVTKAKVKIRIFALELN